MPESPLAAHAATPQELQARMAMARIGSPYLVLRQPDGTQELQTLAARDHLTIGRRPESDVALPWDVRVSRLHAELVLLGHDWVVTDDGLSTNGTWVGDTRLAGRRRLRDGDLIRIGSTLIAFCAPQDADDGTALDDGTGSVVKVTPAQRRVLVALCRPFLTDRSLAAPSNPELAQDLFLSVDAIKTHLRALFDAFGLDGVPGRQKRAALVERAVRTGIVSERDVSDSDR